MSALVDNRRIPGGILVQIDCEECAHLGARHESLERVYATVLGELKAADKNVSLSERQRLHRNSDQAWLDLKVALLEQEMHKRVHLEAHEKNIIER